MSQGSPVAAAVGCIDVTTAQSDSAREAAARLADKYAALASALRSSNSDVADHLSQLRQDLESCLAGLPAQSNSAVQQQSTQQQHHDQQHHDQQQHISQSSVPQAETAQQTAAPQEAHSNALPQYSNSSSGANQNHSQQQQQQRQLPNQILDSPESQQTLELAPAFSERNCMLPSSQQAADPQPCSTSQQQQQHQQPQQQQHLQQYVGVQAPGTAAATSAGAAAAGDGSATQQQGMNSMKSSYRGLTWDRKDQRWRVRVHFLGKQHHVGRFADEVEAARHFDSAAYYLFGDKAITNFGTDAAKAHNGPVPASIRALLPLRGKDWQQPAAGQQEGVNRAHTKHEAAGSGARIPAPAGPPPPPPAAAAISAAAGGGAAAAVEGLHRRKRQPHQFRQLSMHLVQPSSVTPLVMDSTQHQGLQPAGSHNELSSHHHQQQQQQQQSRSPPLLPYHTPVAVHHDHDHHHQQQQQQQQQGCPLPPKLDGIMSVIPEWLNKQVKLMEDLGEPAFKAARFSDGNTGLQDPRHYYHHHHQQQQQQKVHVLHSTAGDAAAVISSAAPGGGVTAREHSLFGQLQRAFGQADATVADTHHHHHQHHRQQQQQPDISGEVLEREITGLQRQLIPELVKLQEQLQQRVSRSQAVSAQMGQFRQKKHQLLRQLQQSIQEMQQLFQMEEQQQLLRAAQTSEHDLLRGLVAGGIGQVPADQLAALAAALLGAPAAPGTGAAGKLACRKRSAPDTPQQSNTAAEIAAAAAAVERDIQAQAGGVGGAAVTLSALAAAIAAIQQSAGAAVTSAPPAAAAAGGGAGRGGFLLGNITNATTSCVPGDEAYAAFFPG